MLRAGLDSHAVLSRSRMSGEINQPAARRGADAGGRDKAGACNSDNRIKQGDVVIIAAGVLSGAGGPRDAATPPVKYGGSR